MKSLSMKFLSVKIYVTITYDNFDKFNRNNYSRRKFEKKRFIIIERLIIINDLFLVQFGKHVMSALLHNAYFRLYL